MFVFYISQWDKIKYFGPLAEAFELHSQQIPKFAMINKNEGVRAIDI